MKYKFFTILITCITVLSSCSKEEQFKTINATSIDFVHEDGTALELNECINPNTNYAIKIKTKSEGDGIFKRTTVEYTLNGVPFVMSFTSDGDQSNPIKLLEGYNRAEIVGTSIKTYIYFNTHDNYQLVE